MSDYIIKVESIGTEYRIRHQQERSVAYPRCAYEPGEGYWVFVIRHGPSYYL